jgi:hypothetical protein
MIQSSTSTTAMSSTTRALSRCLVRLIPTIFLPLRLTPRLTHTSQTQLRFLGHNLSISSRCPSFNRNTTSIHNIIISKARSTQMTWSSTWTRLPLPHLHPLHLPWLPTVGHGRDTTRSLHKYLPPLRFPPHRRLCTPTPPSPVVRQNVDYAHLMMMPAIVGGRTAT